MCLSGDTGLIPLVSLISTVAWASSSRDSSSVVPVIAAWCSAEKLRARQRTRGGKEGRGKREGRSRVEKKQGDERGYKSH